MNEDRRKVAVVTGANGAIGQAICMGMVRHGYEVVMVCRDLERGRNAADRVALAESSAIVRTEIVDLSRKTDIEAFAQRWKGPLTVLINNAASAPGQRRETPEGLEVEFATNVLSYVWMMRAFEKFLRASAPARVVNVASYWAGDLDLTDLQFKRRPYDNNLAYRQSKQANRMLTVAFAQHWPAREITVNSCHPGDAPSTLSHALGFGGSQSAEQAADTPVWLATDPSLAGTTGKYFARRKEQVCEFAKDRQGIAALYDLCGTF
jgi:retinol dehydrogenase-13